MARRWKCLLCSFFCLFLYELLSHLNSAHRECDNFSQTCGLRNCRSQTVYTSPNSFVKHVRSNHRELLFSSYDAIYGENATTDQWEEYYEDEAQEKGE